MPRRAKPEAAGSDEQYIGKYLTTSERVCQDVLKTLSGSDMGQMKQSFYTLILILTNYIMRKADNYRVNGRSFEFNPLFAQNYVGLWPPRQSAGPFFRGRYLG